MPMPRFLISAARDVEHPDGERWLTSYETIGTAETQGWADHLARLFERTLPAHDIIVLDVFPDHVMAPAEELAEAGLPG